ncbi:MULTISPECIES: DUF1684 domain-containing protein [Cecembia]|uniref:DUF1684 domain-containing protein n=2 Tax=Cecembia TaxID=1187078 RepID=K1KUR8_CECL9|nr:MULTISPECIES: DUF1684 domain-containing protein [Cecembia]EKB47930.1 hypothetical protein B879_03456 [Cecembia lonarensis LW9]RZS96408.1 hypothetical protein BC751_1979 [Cecembia calidifontis]
MQKRNILIIGIFVVVGLAFWYTLTRSTDEEIYVENIQKERERQFRFLKFNLDSPLEDHQKSELTSLSFYPIDMSYRVRAKMVPAEDRRMLEIPMTDGTVEKYLKHSYAEFQLNGQPLRLLLLQAAKESDKRNFFLAFADDTSGEETYGGGRYINLRQDGKNSITIDFNMAYNPYCAYNPDYACPLPPRENILEIPIRAGEKDYKKD